MSIVAAILLLLQLPAASTVQMGAIVGQVRAGNGAPAANVRVAATPVTAETMPDGSRTLVSIGQTDSEGRYRLENIPPGAYHVLAGLLDRPTYYPAATQTAAASVVRVTAGLTTQGVDFALVRSAGVTVRGRVVRADGNTTLRQRLYMNSNGNGGVYVPLDIEASPDGSFAFSRVPPGNYTVTLSPGFPGGQPLPITVGETDLTGLEFFIPLIRTVTGRIAVNDGSPLPRLSLSFTNSNATINSSVGNGGAFQLSVPEGDYRVGLSGFPLGYAVEAVTHGERDLSRAVLSVGAADVSGILISFKAPPAEAWLKVRGQVERQASAGTAPNKVVLRGSPVLQDMETSIEADGSFEFPKVLPGTYNAQAVPVSGIQTGVTLSVNRDIDGLKIVIPRQIEVRGRVTVEDGVPVPYVTLSATGKQGVVFASQQTGGGFSLILTEGEHRIALPALPTGYALKSITHGSTDLQTDPLRLSGTGIPEVLVTLAPASPALWRRVSGKVSAPAGSTTLNTLRVALSGPGFNAEVAVNNDGAFEFPKLLQGSYNVWLLPATGLPPTTITVADKDVGGIELRIPNRVSVVGRATMEDGVPLPRASILVDNESMDIGMLKPDGSFTIRLPEGEHRLSIQPHSDAYRVKSMTLGPVNLLQRPATISAADTQQLSIEFQAASPNLWKASGRLRQSPDAAAPSNRVLLGGTVIQNFEASLGADGSFEFPKLPSGTYAVYLQPPGLYSPSAEFVVDGGDVKGIDLASPEVFRINALVSIENGGTAASKATVIRAQTAKPIRGTMGMVESVMDDEDLSLALVAGEYRVTTVRLPAGFIVRSMTYGTTDLLNAPLRVDGPANTRIEVSLRSVDPASIIGVKISGRVKMPPAEGTPRPKTVALSAVQSGGQTFETPIIDGDTFLFSAVPPGTYDARLIGPEIPTAIQQYRKQVVVAGKDLDGVELTAVIWAHVRGRTVLDGPGSLPNFREQHLGVQFRQGSFAIGEAVRPDGSFEMALVRGDYQVALDVPAPYYIKSVSSRGADLVQGRFTHDANGPREIVITLGIRTAPR